MKDRLRRLLAEDRGSSNRIRILLALDKRPRNINQLAEELNLDYKTINHHLSVLMDNGLLQCSGDNYGAVYLPSDQARHHWELIEKLADQTETVNR